MAIVGGGRLVMGCSLVLVTPWDEAGYETYRGGLRVSDDFDDDEARR